MNRRVYLSEGEGGGAGRKEEEEWSEGLLHFANNIINDRRLRGFPLEARGSSGP